MTPPRTNLDDWLLDALDFMDEKITEAIHASSPEAQAMAASEAGGVIPQMHKRLREEDQTKWTSFLLALGDRIDRGGKGYWKQFGGMAKKDFMNEAWQVKKIISALRPICRPLNSEFKQE